MMWRDDQPSLIRRLRCRDLSAITILPQWGGFQTVNEVLEDKLTRQRAIAAAEAAPATVVRTDLAAQPKVLTKEEPITVIPEEPMDGIENADETDE